MMQRLLPLALSLLTSQAIAYPALKDTELYTQNASDCQDVDLNTWQHPARTVLEKNGIKLERVQLCNGGRYPIFQGEVPYDPQGQTKDFFLPLYEQLRKANGKWPYVLVASNYGEMVYVSYPRSDSISLAYENFEAP
ncbi:hypothetical protein [Pseudomonas mediterranea]|uniref:Uncharacterized protein n=1 Tax=Pseudomonas mediterranea TaxID=183795 RepID=A0AAX2DDP6_9PSED|nr:hypothetical protein [Pseudomonas mediterranea]MDU9027659.1 hypothetical protein [Pseudomonas mediterranea]CAH0125510.1 hypothetical protein SRABI112_00045 [Pseudomonas mediterranea]SDU58993.1 hypothetical protein SAMN05216476_3424 [Pseudomonas mediterranea]